VPEEKRRSKQLTHEEVKRDEAAALKARQEQVTCGLLGPACLLARGAMRCLASFMQALHRLSPVGVIAEDFHGDLVSVAHSRAHPLMGGHERDLVDTIIPGGRLFNRYHAAFLISCYRAEFSWPRSTIFGGSSVNTAHARHVHTEIFKSSGVIGIRIYDCSLNAVWRAAVLFMQPVISGC